MHQKYLLILFYSASGSVKNLAHAIADGVEETGMKVRIRTVPKISAKNEKVEATVPDSGEIYCNKEDLINCSGIAIGSPTRFGSIASPLKYFLDSTGDLWATNVLENKPGIAFTSTGSMHGGQETTLNSLITFMLPSFKNFWISSSFSGGKSTINTPSTPASSASLKKDLIPF